MIAGRLVALIGLAQLVCWGISYYLIGVFAGPIGADLGWSRAAVFGGFSGGLVVMGLSSGAVGRAIDRHGGRPVLAAGSGLMAVGFVGLSLVHDFALYLVAWAVLGLAMRMTLYDAAFAALTRIAGPLARRPISQVTLLGGLASTAFWPIGYWLIATFGWRPALWAYAALALATLPVHLAIPRGRHAAAEDLAPPAAPATAGRQREAAFLYLFIMTLAAVVNSALSAHMIPILVAMGVAPLAAVGYSALRGVGQSSARLAELLFGARLSPFSLAVIATGAVPVAMIFGLLAGVAAAGAIAFALVYGAGNGLLTIVRGTLPLVLFDLRSYGATVGRLLAPGFYLAAVSPLGYAVAVERFGDRAALLVMLAVALVVTAAAVVLRARHGEQAGRLQGLRGDAM